MHTTLRYLLIWVVGVLLTHVLSFPGVNQSNREATSRVARVSIKLRHAFTLFLFATPKRIHFQFFVNSSGDVVATKRIFHTNGGLNVGKYIVSFFTVVHIFIQFSRIFVLFSERITELLLNLYRVNIFILEIKAIFI